MDSITLGNYRCFREQQTARLAPLTLLVGENSTGKTSFLALIRALWDVAFGQRAPDFKEDPYDLGSFHEIVNRNKNSSGMAESFMAGFEVTGSDEDTDMPRGPLYFESTFRKLGTQMIPTRRLYRSGSDSIEEIYNHDHVERIRVKTSRGSWQQEVARHARLVRVGGSLEFDDFLAPIFFYVRSFLHQEDSGEGALEPLAGSPTFAEADLEAMEELLFSYEVHPWRRPVAGAPVRSKPYRTYDPSRPTWDPEGDYVPMYLAGLHSQEDRSGWDELLGRFERFGRESGLFGKITIKQLGGREGGPFQIEVRHPASAGNGTQHNLIDVGYGVSQVLPLVTELLRKDAPKVLLLQQPEVHLHPSAQAALGSLFCQVSSRDKQLFIETHSDYILDRIRMDIRDGTTSLSSDDVSVLFFERGNSGVRIHSLRIDEAGNIIDRPKGYRNFFARETRRSIGL